MDINYQPDDLTIAGTLGGVLIVLFLQVNLAALFETAVIAGVGATVSFSVSLFLKWLIGKIVKRKANGV